MKKLITSLALVLTALFSYAITPLWIRDARISPDGKEIVFCYKGDIYRVPVQGGTATQLTTQASYEANPVWSQMVNKSRLPATRMGTSISLSCLPMEELHVG